MLPELRTLEQLRPNKHWQWLLALDCGGTLAWSHVPAMIFPLINLPHSVSPFPPPRCLFLSSSPPDQETSPRLPARLAAAGNAAVRVALTAQKGKEGEGREGEERQRAGAQEEQSQEDEVNKIIWNGGINGNQTVQGCMNKLSRWCLCCHLTFGLMCCHISWNTSKDWSEEGGKHQK